LLNVCALPIHQAEVVEASFAPGLIENVSLCPVPRRRKALDNQLLMAAIKPTNAGEKMFSFDF
jgi:hypothetical protein